MKKVFMIMGTCLMAALVVISCSKKPTPDPKPTPEPEPEPEPEFTMEVSIDGDFSEWDTLTSETADGESYILEENSSSDLNGLLCVKATSDKDNIYIYAEILYENVFQAEGGPFTLGDSNNGFLPTHPGTPGPLWVWIDGDNDASGAVATADEEEALWDYEGFDAPIQYYIAYDVAASKMCLGWQQMNWPMDGEDYLSSNSVDWGRAFVSGEGWDPTTDNVATVAGNIGFSAPKSLKDPVTKGNVQAVQVEIAIDRGAILPTGNAVSGTVFIGVDYENVGDVAACAHNYLSEISGKIPSGSKPFSLKLQ